MSRHRWRSIVLFTAIVFGFAGGAEAAQYKVRYVQTGSIDSPFVQAAQTVYQQFTPIFGRELLDRIREVK